MQRIDQVIYRTLAANQYNKHTHKLYTCIDVRVCVCAWCCAVATTIEQ